MSDFEAMEIKDQIIDALSFKLEKDFGAKVTPETVLRLAKELGFVKGKLGRTRATFALPAGTAFLSSQCVQEDEAEECSQECGNCSCETSEDRMNAKLWEEDLNSNDNNKFTLLNQENDTDVVPF